MTRAKAIIGSYVGVLVLAAPVFLGAWKLVYWQGLLYVGVALAGTTLNHLLVREGSDLTVDRASRAQEGQDWDKRVLGAYFLASVVTFAVAGLDSGRFGWSGQVPIWVAIAGVVLMLVGQVLFALAKRENAFFSSETITLDYWPGGLLNHLSDALQRPHTFNFDSMGRLVFDGDPEGGSKTLTPSAVPGGRSITVTTGLGRSTSYAVERPGRPPHCARSCCRPASREQRCRAPTGW